MPLYWLNAPLWCARDKGWGHADEEEKKEWIETKNVSTNPATIANVTTLEPDTWNLTKRFRFSSKCYQPKHLRDDNLYIKSSWLVLTKKLDYTTDKWAKRNPRLTDFGCNVCRQSKHQKQPKLKVTQVAVQSKSNIEMRPSTFSKTKVQ